MTLPPAAHRARAAHAETRTTSPAKLAAVLLLAALLARDARADTQGPADTSQACSTSLVLPADSIQLLVEVRVGRFASVVVPAIESPCYVLLVEARPILAVAELATVVRGRSIHARLPSGERLAIELARRRIRRGRASWQLATGALRETSAGALLSLEALGRLLGVEAVYDSAGAAIDFCGVDGLPVAVRARRDARLVARDSARLEAARAAEAIPLVEGTRSGARSMVIEYNVHVASDLGVAGGAASRSAAGPATDIWTSFGVEIPTAGGLAESRWGGRGRPMLEGGAWSRAWPGAKGVSEVRVGDVQPAGARRDLVRGFSITNAALSPPLVASTIAVAGRVPLGWTIDAMRGDAPLDVAMASDGSYALGVPLQLGTTVVDFVASGPMGEQRLYRQSFHTPPAFVTPGRTEYAASIGACVRRTSVLTTSGVESRRDCRAAANAELRHAAGPRVTLRVGSDAVLPLAGKNYRATARPYGGAGILLGRATIVEGLYAPRASGEPGVSMLRARFEPSPSLVMSTDFASSDVIALARVRTGGTDPSGALPLELQYVRGRRLTSWMRVAPSRWHDRTALEAMATTSAYGAQSLATQRITVPVSWGGVRVAPYWNRTTGEAAPGSRTAEGIDATLLAPFAMRRSLGAVWLGATLEQSPGRAVAWRGSMVRASQRMRVEVAARGGGVRSGTTWTLSVVPQLRHVQGASMTTLGGANEATRTTQSVHGSVMLDAATRTARWSAEGAAGRGGVEGRVFVDRDGDGKRSEGETLVAGVRVEVANRSVATDANGHFVAWGDVAHSEVLVRVDTMSLASPWWIPASAAIRARIPNGARVAVDIPLVMGGIVEGRLMPSDSLAASIGFEGMRLIMTERRSGATRSIDVFHDGAFYRSGIAPGEYVLSVDPRSLANRAIVIEPVPVALRGASESGDVATLVLPVRSAR